MRLASFRYEFIHVNVAYVDSNRCEESKDEHEGKHGVEVVYQEECNKEYRVTNLGNFEQIFAPIEVSKAW